MSNYFRTIATICATIVFWSCNSGKDIETNDTVLSVFSDSEARDLQEIHDFFSDQICTSVHLENDDPVKCFEKFMTESKEFGQSGTFESPLKDGAEDELFNNLESDIFDEIWQWETVIGHQLDTNKYLELNAFGKYSEFLLEVGKEDTMIRNYHEGLQRAGVISATMVASVLMIPEKYNIQDPRVRLIISIHYLTLFYD